MPVASIGERVLLVSAQGKRYYVTLVPGSTLHTNKGIIAHDDLIGCAYGRVVNSHIGHPFIVLRPSFHDELMNMRRASQIIYPKELGLILFKLDVRRGRRIIEAGTGSGALTLALANGVAPHGRVYSYDAREDMLRLAQQNLARVGLADCVEFAQRDIADGFVQADVDALFLDVREPWLYLDQTCRALGDGGFFGAIVPTTNQISELLFALERYPFIDAEVFEMLLREYKPVPGRLRPCDVMVGHTGYLLFARKVNDEARAAQFAGPDDADASPAGK